jgi:chromosome segregation ATPase
MTTNKPSKPELEKVAERYAGLWLMMPEVSDFETRKAQVFKSILRSLHEVADPLLEKLDATIVFNGAAWACSESVARHVDQLRAENEKLKEALNHRREVIDNFKLDRDTLKKQIAELEKDKDRLDWLCEKSGGDRFMDICLNLEDETVSLRQTIDSAMQPSPQTIG